MAVACLDTQDEMKWYVLKVKAHKEDYVRMQLWSADQVATYCPLMKTAKRHRMKWQREIEFVFPGYVFVRIDLDRQMLHLRRLHGHTGLVQFDGRPAWVAEEFIEEFRRRETPGGYIRYRPETPLRDRGRVRVVSGPFRGQTGVFLGYRSGSERVCLLLELMNSYRPVEVPTAAVETVAV
jgi:transcription antitermination factor NusG